MAKKDTEYGLSSDGVTPAERQAAAGGVSDLSSAESVRAWYALDNLREDETLGSVEIGRQDDGLPGEPGERATFAEDGSVLDPGKRRRAPFGD